MADWHEIEISGYADGSKDPADRHLHWVKAGSNPVYLAILGGRVEAVLYWTEGLAGTQGPDDEPVVAPPGWLWFPSDRSDDHHELRLGEIPPGDATTLDPVHQAALEAGVAALTEYRGGGAAGLLNQAQTGVAANLSRLGRIGLDALERLGGAAR